MSCRPACRLRSFLSGSQYPRPHARPFRKTLHLPTDRCSTCSAALSVFVPHPEDAFAPCAPAEGPDTLRGSHHSENAELPHRNPLPDSRPLRTLPDAPCGTALPPPFAPDGEGAHPLPCPWQAPEWISAQEHRHIPLLPPEGPEWFQRSSEAGTEQRQWFRR